MQITDITNCTRPRRIGFTSVNNQNAHEKKRYKHFEQLSDEALSLRSVLKAHNEVMQSNKMRVYKSIPAITTIIAGASIALAQPGKLATKAKTGLGFLALKAGMDLVSDFVSPYFDKKYARKEKTEKNEIKKALQQTGTIVGLTAGIALGAVSVMKNVSNMKAFKPAIDILQNESQKFSQEINSSKLGKFFENTIGPLANKHKKAANILSAVSPFAAIIAGNAANIKMAESISSDIKEKADFNFVKGKYIQQQAREHFESIDAEEV